MCGPGAGRVGGRTSEEHLAGGDVNEEQYVEALERGGVNGEEVTRHSGLGVKELLPGDLRSIWGWVDTVGFEDLPDGGRGEPVAEADEFAALSVRVR